ncbi:MAG: hypothetical protein E6J62_04075 [Deltaproteobacteria bacterium]|nr:MAG: hypothetical protein E6J85_20535 [Deltaproteobacteria bacterium]TMB25723.1 MAG: hypothetical protein E6J61_23460 [Deltaproteobacteria bacterium]TMB38044.1 MAG: hypothetical protein E6J62_04075 [Deltaproteobacteria bacterium]
MWSCRRIDKQFSGRSACRANRRVPVCRGTVLPFCLVLAAAASVRAAGVTDKDILNDATTPGDVVSYGMGPHAQRYSPLAKIFLPPLRRGVFRDDRTLMPKFEGVVSQEGIWAIRAFLDAIYEE